MQLVLKMYVLQLQSKGFHKLQGFKNSVFAEMKNRFGKEEVAECSVCQFVKSNCLIGFDQEEATVGLLPNWEIQNGFFTYFSD